jgi:[histone H3]-trimethyl-L-lysine4 demethylase
LKIARGKVKEDDKYTCPICDYRVKIPRDAARPRLEDLQAWQDEIPSLPFQPEEEECLANIVDHAQEFRHFMTTYTNPMLSNPEELTTQRFYLRKIEGADILLADETNFFKQELHKWAPVAPVPPPLISVSLSTRKPRPTKQQKMMIALGIDDPADLPDEVRPKQTSNKRKLMDQGAAASPLNGTRSNSRSHTPAGLPKYPDVDSIIPRTTTSLHTTTSPNFGLADIGVSSYEQGSGFASRNFLPESPNYRQPSPGTEVMDPALFSETYNRSVRVGSPLINHYPNSSPHEVLNGGEAAGMDTMFAELTNQSDPIDEMNGIIDHGERSLEPKHVESEVDGQALVAQFLHDDTI